MDHLIDYAGQSDVGCVRSGNQDRWGADAEQCLFIVADGVAGSTDGALAAHLVVELLPTYVRRRIDGEAKPDQLSRAVAELSNDLFLAGVASTRVAGATSTVVAALIAGSRLLIAHLGDSRAYLFRGRELQQLTHDHSLVQALVDAGQVTPEEAAKHPARNIINRFAAMPPPALPDAAEVELQNGDRLLLCSDGLYGVAGESAVAEILGAWSAPADACAALIEAARRAGGYDNITAVVIDMPSAASAAPQ